MQQIRRWIHVPVHPQLGEQLDAYLERHMGVYPKATGARERKAAELTATLLMFALNNIDVPPAPPRIDLQAEAKRQGFVLVRPLGM